MVFRRKFRKAVRRAKPRARVGRKTGGVTKAVKRYVKRTFASQTENKRANINSAATFGNVAHNATLNAYPMLPYTGYWSIGQGVTQGTRIGNQVKVRKLMLNYVLRPMPYNATTNVVPQPTEVDLFLGYLNQNSGTLPVAADISNLFQSGAGVAAPVGTLRDLISSINADYWTIKKRWRHKIGYAAYGGTGTDAPSQSYTNNDFKLNVVKKLNITNLVNKNLKFNDATSSVQGKNLFFMFQAVASSGGAFSATTTPCNIEFWIDLEYEDA